MSIQRYFRCNAPETRAALERFRATHQVLVESTEAFAAHFGGKAVRAISVHGYRFHGVRFDPPKDDPMWTKPNKGQCQRPRTALHKSVKSDDRKAMAPKLRELRQEWNDHYPKASTDTGEVLSTVGLDWAAFLFHGGRMCFFAPDGAFYMQTAANPNDRAEEITGSEFDAATKQVAA